MWRQDIAEEKQAQPQMARGCLCLSINAKQTTSLGKEDISLFISFLSLSLSLFFWAYINFESKGERQRGCNTGRERHRQGQRKGKRKEERSR